MSFLSTFIGIGSYADLNIHELVGATRDAKALHALVADSIPTSSPNLLVDADATPLY
jgi:hypothetical protein